MRPYFLERNFFEIEQVAGAKIEVYYNDELAIAKDVI